jgi:hypothetical protein
MKTTTTVIPADILQYFNPLLLSAPAPNLKESSRTLWDIYLYAKHLMKKAHKYPQWGRKLKKLEKTFLEIYERALVKEKELKESNEHPTQQPFYYIRAPDKKGRNVFRGLGIDQKALYYTYKLRRDNAI